MAQLQPVYETVEDSSKNELDYFFISTGKKEITKIVRYSFIKYMYGRINFNLGFGDYDAVNDDLIDSSIDNNGDVYAVFHTILGTIPRFFEIYPDAILTVKGSDSSPDFARHCFIHCTKGCTQYCKNLHRRINIYKGYINKNLNSLKERYHFYGRSVDANGEIVAERYKPNNSYHTILLSKTSINFTT